MSYSSKMTVVGNLGQDPEERSLNDGTPVVNFSVADTQRFKDRATGENREVTTWYRASVFGKTAAVAMRYLQKGDAVLLEGVPKASAYVPRDNSEPNMPLCDDSGWPVARAQLNLRVTQLRLLPNGRKGQNDYTTAQDAINQALYEDSYAPAGESADEIPF
jgi:single stranded DNA-binding protein